MKGGSDRQGGGTVTPASRRMASPPHLLLSLLACLTFLPPLACTASPRATPALTSVEQVTRLSLVERQRGYPVAIRAIVTEYDVFRYRGAEYPNLFVHDGVAGIYVVLGDRRFPLQPGDVVDLSGRTAASSGGVVIKDPDLRVVRHGRLPLPTPSSFQDLASGRRFGDWVEVHGTIRYLYAEGNWVTMDLFMDDGVVELLLPDRSADKHPPDLARLVGARVSVHATVAESLIESRVRLYIPGSGRSHIQIDPPSEGNTTPPKALSVAQIYKPWGRAAWGDRVRTAGIITYHNGMTFAIQDGPAGVLASTREDPGPLAPGDRVEVVGYLVPSEPAPRLTYCSFRKLGPGPPWKAARVTAQAVLAAGMNAQMVEVEGTLTASAYKQGRLQLTFEAGNVRFNTELAGEGVAAEPDMVSGSAWRITGLALLQRDRPGAGFSTFRLLLPSDKELVLTHRASALTSSRLRYALGISVALIVMAALGILTLRRRIRIQTAIIRERLEKEAALEQRYRDLFENANDVVFSYDLTGRLIAINAAGKRLLGYSTEQFTQLDLMELVVPEQRESVRQRLEALQSGLAVPPFEMEIATAHSRAILEVSDRIVKQVDGSLIVEAIARDIGQHKQAAAELREAKLLAEASSRAKSEFLANMSHEIRTPMNGVLGMTELVLSTPVTPDQREWLEMVKSSGAALLTILNDILDFSKIEAGKLDIDPVWFCLYDSIFEAIPALAFQAHQKGLELTCEIHPDVPGHVHADPVRIRQILVNLLSNAIKFTDQGEVGLEVTADLREQDQILLHFTVRDTGIGIPVDKQRVIFEPFSQADGSTTRRFGGTGLGLTISSQLASLMHGRIWVESNQGEGSCFHLSIPAGTMNDSPTLSAAELAGLAGMPVLVVDDNGASRRILCEMLARWEMRPAAAADGKEAFLLLRNAERNQTSFALALIDAAMPGMDGFALTAQIRHDPGLVGPIILLMSPAPRPDDDARCRELGVDTHLTKPVGRTGLWKALRKASGEAVPREDHRPAFTKRQDRQGPRRPLCVLVAEDNLVNQIVAVRLIEKRGHSVVVAANGREALAAIERYDFDLVLMDAQMPEMDGFEATAVIREREKLTGGHLPIIALTAHAMAGDRERCLAAGMDHYLTKPIQPVQLFDAIEEMTSTAPPCATAEAAPPEFPTRGPR